MQTCQQKQLQHVIGGHHVHLGQGLGSMSYHQKITKRLAVLAHLIGSINTKKQHYCELLKNSIDGGKGTCNNFSAKQSLKACVPPPLTANFMVMSCETRLIDAKSNNVDFPSLPPFLHSSPIPHTHTLPSIPPPYRTLTLHPQCWSSSLSKASAWPSTPSR